MQNSLMDLREIDKRKDEKAPTFAEGEKAQRRKVKLFFISTWTGNLQEKICVAFCDRLLNLSVFSFESSRKES